MLDGVLYLVGKEHTTGAYVEKATPCAMCRRMIINAGIKQVIVRDNKEDFRVINVYDEWVVHDESLEGAFGY